MSLALPLRVASALVVAGFVLFPPFAPPELASRVASSDEPVGEEGLPYLNAVWVEAQAGGEFRYHALIDVGRVVSPRLDLAVQFRLADDVGTIVQEKGGEKALLLWQETWQRGAAATSPIWRPAPVAISARFLAERANLSPGSHVVEAAFDVYDPGANRYVEAGSFWRATFLYDLAADGSATLRVVPPSGTFRHRDVAQMPPPPVVWRTDEDLRVGSAAVRLEGYGLPAARVLGTLGFRAGRSANWIGFAPGGRALLTSGETGPIVVFDVATGAVSRSLPGLAVSMPDGSHLVLSAAELLDPATGTRRVLLAEAPARPMAALLLLGAGELRVATATEVLAFDAATGALRRRVPLSPIPGDVESEGDASLPYATRFDPSGRRLARTWGEGKRFGIDVHDAVTGALVLRTFAVYGASPMLALTADGATLATSAYEWGDPNGLALFDAATGEKRADVPDTADVVAVALSPDGTLLAAGGRSGASLHDPATGALRRRLPVDGAVEAIGFSPDGRTLWANGPYGLATFDVAAGAVLAKPSFSGPTVLSGDGHTAATLCEDGVVRVWDCRTGALAPAEPTYTSIVFSKDGTRVAGVEADGRVRVWDTTSGKNLLTLSAGRGPLALSPGGRHLAAGIHGTAPLLWDVDRGEVVFAPRERQGIGASAAFSPDGRLVAVPWSDQTLKVYDLATQRIVLGGSLTTSVSALEFTPDGLRLGLVAQYGVVQADVAPGSTLRQVLSCPSSHGMAYAPDGKRFVACSQPPEIFDATTGESRVRLDVTDAYRPEFAFSPDGARVAAVLDGGRVLLFDAADGRLVTTLVGSLRLTSAAFSADGRLLHTSCENSAIVTWTLP